MSYRLWRKRESLGLLVDFKIFFFSDSLVDRFPGGELERVLSLLREHNLALLTLILHLMVSIQKLDRQEREN
jgi:hypothetical protein